jgi:mannose-6-phosphate isomerase-like protein (cupin superfamily)
MDIPQITSNTNSATGEMGQDYLATGKQVALRRWEADACGFCEPRCRDYEAVGYLLEGDLVLDLDGELVTLKCGDSWLVPQGATHRYQVVTPIVAIEATSPPARFNGRDEAT